MKRSDVQIKKYLTPEEHISHTASGPAGLCDPAGLCGSDGLRLRETIRLSKAAFYEMEAQGQLSRAEFIYQQSRYIRKCWWMLQAALLLILWFLLAISESGSVVRKCMGAAAPLFAILLLPELWKNRSTDATEIEGTAFYSLRQVYAARIFLFAIVDFLLLGTFFAAVVLTGKMLPQEILFQFFLPYSVTCCICFGTLYSRRIGSEPFALLACTVWCVLWIQLAANERIYEMLSAPACLAVTLAAAFYTGYCIFRGQKEWRNIYAVRETV